MLCCSSQVTATPFSTWSVTFLYKPNEKWFRLDLLSHIRKEAEGESYLQCGADSQTGRIENGRDLMSGEL